MPPKRRVQSEDFCKFLLFTFWRQFELSLFKTIPASFPLDVDLTTRPATYRLESDIIDKIAAIFALFGYSFGVAGLLFMLVDWLAIETFFPDSSMTIGLGAAALYLAFAIPVWLLPKFARTLRFADVTIGEATVSVKGGTLLSRNDWELPIAEFEGTALINLGTHDVEGDKMPVYSVIMKHQDPRLSVPIAVASASRIGAATVERKAAQLNLPSIDGICDVASEAPYPAGTLFINRRQALKVYLIFALSALLAAGMTAGAIVQSRVDGLDWILLAILGTGFLPAAGMWLYSLLYVVDMKEVEGAIWLKTAALLSKPYRVELGTVQSLQAHEGKTPSVAGLEVANRSMLYHRIHTPWGDLRIRGRRLPLIIDRQAEYVNETRLKRLIRNART